MSAKCINVNVLQKIEITDLKPFFVVGQNTSVLIILSTAV